MLYVSLLNIFSYQYVRISDSEDALINADLMQLLLDEFQKLLVTLYLQGYSDLAASFRHEAVE